MRSFGISAVAALALSLGLVGAHQVCAEGARGLSVYPYAAWTHVLILGPSTLAPQEEESKERAEENRNDPDVQLREARMAMARETLLKHGKPTPTTIGKQGPASEAEVEAVEEAARRAVEEDVQRAGPRSESLMTPAERERLEQLKEIDALNWDPRSRPTFGHTFLRHGQGPKIEKSLRGRAAGTGQSQGQWTDDDAAAEYLRRIRPFVNEPKTVPIPEKVGQVILPNGATMPASFAFVVPAPNGGYRSAFPVLDAEAPQPVEE